MNADELRSKLRDIRFKKCWVLLFTGDRGKFLSLVKQLPETRVVSVRDALMEECQKRGIDGLNSENVTSVAKSVIPRVKDSVNALVDTELFVKYDMIKTLLMGQDYYTRTYLVHIPERYTSFFDKLELTEVG